MYQPYDPYVVYQPYNDPQPEHYASGVPQGMPQPSRPSVFGSGDPAYASYQDQIYGANNSYDAHYGSQPYGAQAQGQPSYYPANPATPVPDYGSVSHTGSHHYPPVGQSGPTLSHTTSHHYPPTAPSESSFYPSVSSAPYSSQAEPPGEDSWAPSYPPRKEKVKDERPVFSTHSVPKRDEKKENVSFSVDEAQAIIKQLKETNKNLSLQLTNSRESNSKVVHEKDKRIEQLQKEIDAARSQQAQAVNAKEAVAAVEGEWKQRMSVKEQENQELRARAQKDAEVKAQLERDWAERLSKAEQEIAALLARFSKLQSDADAERAFLLETNTAQEAELAKLREGTEQRDTELLRLKDETNKQESELMKLREETGKLLDEITQMVDEKENTRLSIKHLEEDKHELEERLRGNSDVGAAEKVKLLRKIDDLEDELDHARELCEERRLRIESMENEELPTLNSQIELMTTLDEKARDQIAELKEKLEETKHARDGLEKQLFKAEQREMENDLRVAGESKSAAEELQRLKFELDNHMLGKSDNEKLASQLESEKKILEQKVAQVEDEKREALGRISTLEISLKDVSQAKTELEDELEIVRETMEREAEDNETSQAEYRSKIEELAEQVSTLTSSKSNLETQVAQSETKINETERLLHATEDMLKVLNEDLEQKRKFESVAKGMESVNEEKTVLEGKFASLQEEKVQMSEQISELTKKVEGLEKEKEQLLNELDVYDKEISKLEAQLEEADVAVIAKKRLEREVKGLKFELSKEKSEVERVQAEMEELGKIGQDASLRIIDLEQERDQVRADLEARCAALTEDKKRASVKASELGEEILTLDTECKELKQRFGEMNFKYLEIVAERDELQQEKRNLRSK